MTPRNKRLLRWLGYPALALTVFVMTVHLTLPYERVRERLQTAMAAVLSSDVSIESVSPGFLPGHVRVKGITLTTRPTSDAVKPTTLLIEHIDLNVGLLALVGKTVSLGIDAELGDGRVVGSFSWSWSDGDIEVDLRTRDLPLESIPGVAVVTAGAPIKGGLEANIAVKMPQGKWHDAEGRIELGCADCTIGDGVTKVRPVVPGQTSAFTGEGFTLPRIKLGQMEGKIAIGKGTACIQSFRTKSPHGELIVEGGLKLADPFGQSQVQLYTRFMLTEAFRKESPRNQDFDTLFTAGAKQADGWATYMARTSIGLLRWLPARVPPPPMKECGGSAAPPPPPPPVTASRSNGLRGTLDPAAPLPGSAPAAPAPSPSVMERGGEGAAADASVAVPAPLPVPPPVAPESPPPALAPEVTPPPAPEPAPAAPAPEPTAAPAPPPEPETHEQPQQPQGY